jgi:hypothetical protein
MKNIHMASITAQFRQVFTWLVHDIECACMIIIGRSRSLDGHVLPRQSYAEPSWHARQCSSSGASSCLTHHRDRARAQGAECSSYRIAASAVSRSKKRQPPETTRQCDNALGHNSVTLIRFVLSAVSKGAPPRRTWSITSSGTAAAWRCFGARQTGNHYDALVTIPANHGLNAARGKGGANRYQSKALDRCPRKFITRAKLEFLL